MPFSCLFESCLKALKLASRYMKGSCHEAAMKKLAFRLNLAEDVVHSYPSMDAILTKEEQGERVYENLRAAIIGALVDVGLIEGKPLLILNPPPPPLINREEAHTDAQNVQNDSSARCTNTAPTATGTGSASCGRKSAPCWR